MDQNIVALISLGNPGVEYANTRHNVGFMVADALGDKLGISFKSKGLRGSLGEGFFEGRKLIVVKPGTYMNLSGLCVKAVMDFYRIPPPAVFVVSDDFNLPLGSIRIRRNGGSGGHNGLASIIQELSSEEFPRMRIGIGPLPPGAETMRYVLQPFSLKEREVLPSVINTAVQALEALLSNGIERAMSQFNARQKQEEGSET
ncbi:MAG: aminoacyl-tRNA hydrolase [Candidatus Eremiobacteraeota bacterium]|nr:aminoacyl-tRNA hydrolase [Candidatus Eremiobacteraeota bacterium]